MTIKLGTSIDLFVKRSPAPADGPWPNGDPVWSIIGSPTDFSIGQLIPSVGPTTTFIPRDTGVWKIRVACCDSFDEIEINVTEKCDWIQGVSADSCYETITQTGGFTGSAFHVVGLKGGEESTVTLSLTMADGADPQQVTWEGATQNSDNRLEADVPIDQSVMKHVTIRYGNTACRDILVWPVWGEVSFQTSGTLDPDNHATLLKGEEFPESYGGGNTLGVIDERSHPSFAAYGHAGGRIQVTGTMTPLGVGKFLDNKLAFRRTRHSICWHNGGHYVNELWTKGPIPATSGVLGDTSDDFCLDLKPGEGDKVFDLDIPAEDAKISRRTAEKYVWFEQYLQYKSCEDFKTASEVKIWSYQCRIDFDLPVDKRITLNELLPTGIDLPDEPFYPKR